MPSHKPLAAIVRSSDRVAERQREGTYHGDVDQVDEISHYCRSRGLAYELLEPELDVSGGMAIRERPSLRAAIEGVEAGIYSGIVTANLKRLTRSRSGIEIWDRVEAAGGRIHTAAEQTDTSTPTGRFIRDIHLADAVREREEHAERYDRRRQKTVEAGIWRPRQVPRGYAFAGPAVDGKCRGAARRLVPDDHASDIAYAFRAAAGGTSLTTIGERLQMTPSGVRALLKNRVYLGELRDGSYVNPSAHEPIVTPEEFEAAQRWRPRRPRTFQAPALLAGVARCASCGHVMTRTRAATVIYSCPRFHSGARCPRPAAITAATLDEYLRAVARIELAQLRVSATHGERVEQARLAVEAAKSELAVLVRSVTAAGLDERDYITEMRDRKHAVERADATLRAERLRTPALPIHGDDAAAAFDGLSIHGQNEVLRGLFAAVVVQPVGRGKRVDVLNRTRIIRSGSELIAMTSVGGPEKGTGIVAIWPDVDHPDVLGPLASEGTAERVGAAEQMG